MKLRIEKDIFRYFPGIRIATAQARIKSIKDPAGIDEYLKKAWRFAGEEGVKYGNPQSHPNIKPWGESMKALGVSRKDFPSSIESLVRRATKTEGPIRINPIVDFYNAVSLANIIPAGAYDIDDLKNDLMLRLSQAGDTFESLDSEAAIPVPEGEVSYTDGKIVITRHFVWKQSKHLLTTEKSRNIILLAEALGEIPFETADKVLFDFESGLARYFDAEVRGCILDEGTPEFELV